VLVVTHLPQVAAFADHQVVVTKDDRNGRTFASAAAVDGPDRVVELSRMLSGQPWSGTARDHAEELLATAAAQRMSMRPAGGPAAAGQRRSMRPAELPAPAAQRRAR
jgi:DNA repair protein RecN (Recombination protein N)